jgi:hypothetical protein
MLRLLSDKAWPLPEPGTQGSSVVPIERVVPDSVGQRHGETYNGSGRVACIVMLLLLVAPPLPLTVSVTV